MFRLNPASRLAKSNETCARARATIDSRFKGERATVDDDDDDDDDDDEAARANKKRRPAQRNARSLRARAQRLFFTARAALRRRAPPPPSLIGRARVNERGALAIKARHAQHAYQDERRPQSRAPSTS